MSSVAAARPGMSRTRVIAATTIGNALEFFDFTVYSFLAVVIGRLFFPTMSPYGQLLLSVATFGVGFFMRPLGGIVIGAYADRRGRKAAMTLTINLMALGCAMIALAPTYAQAGLAAPLIIVLARLIQGFSAGGEVGASTTMLIEYASPRNRGYYASWQFASQGLGVTIGATLAGVLSATLSPEALDSWGWRVPFAVGVLILPVGVYIRRQLEETLEPRDHGKVEHGPVVTALRDHWRLVLLGILLTVGGTVSAYIITFYMPTYAIRELGLPMPMALLAGILSGFITFVASPFVGLAADRAGRKKLILGARLATLVLVYPCFLWLNAGPSPERLLIVVGVLSVLLAIQTAPAITMVPELFPKAVRATGMSIVYSIGVALFGGFAQFIATWLINLTGDKLSPAYYLIACLVVSTLALIGLEDRTGREIDGRK